MEDYTDNIFDIEPSTTETKMNNGHTPHFFEGQEFNLENYVNREISVPGPSNISHRYYFDEPDHKVHKEFKRDIWSDSYPVYRDLPPELQPLPIGCKNIIIQVSDKPETDDKSILIDDIRVDFNERPNPEHPEDRLIEIVSPKPLDKLIAEFKFSDTKDVEHVEITMEVGKDVIDKHNCGEIVWIDNNKTTPYKRFDMNKLCRGETYLFQQIEPTLMTSPHQIKHHYKSKLIADSDPFLGVPWRDVTKSRKPTKEEERLSVRGINLTDSPGHVRCKKRGTYKRNPFRNKAFRSSAKVSHSDHMSSSTNYPDSSSSSWGAAKPITHSKVREMKRHTGGKVSSSWSRPEPTNVDNLPRHYDPLQSPWNDLHIIAQQGCSNQNYYKKRDFTNVNREERKFHNKANSNARKQGQFYTNRTAYARENLLPGCSRTDFSFTVDPNQNRGNRNKFHDKTSYHASSNAFHTDIQTPFTTKCIHGNNIFPPYSDALKRSNIVIENYNIIDPQINPEDNRSPRVEAESNYPDTKQTPDLLDVQKSRRKNFNYNIHRQICRLNNETCRYCNHLSNLIEPAKGSYGDDLIRDDTFVNQFSDKDSSCPYCELLWYNQSFNERSSANKETVLSITDSVTNSRNGHCSPTEPTFKDVGVQCSEQNITKPVATNDYREEEGNIIIVDEIDEDFEYEEIPSNVAMKKSQENGKSLLEVLDGKFAGVYHKVQNLRGVDGAILLVGVNNKDPVYYIDESLISPKHCHSTDRLYLLEMYAGNDEYKYSVVLGDGRHFGVKTKNEFSYPELVEEQICSIDPDHSRS